MATKQDTHIVGGKTTKAPGEDIHGAVTQKHRLRLGDADGIHNPNGVGQPSTKSSISNGNKGW